MTFTREAIRESIIREMFGKRVISNSTGGK
jgi:hypothetical protein